MTAIALISQPMRYSYCIAYVRAHPEFNWVVLTEHSAARFRESGPEYLTVRLLTSDQSPRGSTLYSILRRMRWRLTAWSHSGSTIGRMMARLTRSILRFFWTAIGPQSIPQSSNGAKTRNRTANERILATLGELDSMHPIELVAVFDLFDLPAALAFAENRELSVLVR